MLGLSPIEYGVRRLLSGHRSLEQVADRVTVIEPASKQIVPPATFIEDTLSRVTGVDEFSQLDLQLRRVRGGEVEHAAVVAYHLKPATLWGHLVFCKGHKKLLAPNSKTSLKDVVTAEHMTTAAVGCTYMGNRFFGHFLVDDVPLMMLAEEMGPLIRTARNLPPHHAELLELLDLNVKPLSAATFDELVVTVDHGQSRSKEARFRRLRAILREKFGSQSSPPGAFIARGTKGQSRLCRNEDEVAAALEARGFVTVRPEGLSTAEIAKAVQGAPIIIGVEGSHLTHGLFNMADGGAMIALNPPMRFVNIFKNFTDCLGMRYGIVIGRECEGGFDIDIDEVWKVLDMIQSAPTAVR